MEPKTPVTDEDDDRDTIPAPPPLSFLEESSADETWRAPGVPEFDE